MESGAIAGRPLPLLTEMEFMAILAFVMNSARLIGKRDRAITLRNGFAFAFLFAQAFVTMERSHGGPPYLSSLPV